ncbi:peptide chain release factor 1-like, mitochondrial isoform X2 [Brachyhypopomus gauderio]|uniref:peptide chain release factor 1-like, mitochondrial isoform X2 n=1 Tax=Brachyhypopomus gauderio TaxID=698409 RepID=UPI0040416AF5
MAIAKMVPMRQLLSLTVLKQIRNYARPFRESASISTIANQTFWQLLIHQRNIHVTNSAMVTRILTVDEIFSKKSLHDYLKKVETEYENCLQAVNAADIQTDNEDLRTKRTRMSSLAPLIREIKDLELKEREFDENEALLKENDPDLRELAQTEMEACQAAIQETKQTILSLLVPEEESDMSDLVLEVTAGVGGGVRHAKASISGPLTYKKMKFEAGVHRVQRVPKTEKQGRVHTSTMTVAILPQPAEISFTINPKDLRIETKRASGAGGQHVNTTDSAVRIVHLPTGIVSECQQERSQIKNKEMALKVLRAKLYSAKLEEATSKRYQTRKLQIGTKGRSEKIRTYNFSQDRVTDHRIGKSLFGVHGFLLGEELLDELSASLQQFSEQEDLMDILEDK